MTVAFAARVGNGPIKLAPPLGLTSKIVTVGKSDVTPRVKVPLAASFNPSNTAPSIGAER